MLSSSSYVCIMSYWFQTILIRIIDSIHVIYQSQVSPEAAWLPEVPTWQGHWTGEHKPSSSWWEPKITCANNGRRYSTLMLRFGKLWWSTGLCNTMVCTSTWAKTQCQVFASWLWGWYTDISDMLVSTLINWGNTHTHKLTHESIHFLLHQEWKR